MTSGTFDISRVTGPIPLHSPPYPHTTHKFSDVEGLFVRYKTDAEKVKHLIPSQLKLLSDKPSAFCAILRYGMSSIGPYSEFLQAVHVGYEGREYIYPLELILDNEGAIYSGREQFGYPKVFGNVIFEPSDAKANTYNTGYITGLVERPHGQPLAHFGFKPFEKVQDFGPLPRDGPEGPKLLNLRSIPSPNAGEPPLSRQFLEIDMHFTEAEVWTGDGTVTFTGMSDFDPLHKVPAVEYEGATFMRKAHAILHPVTKTYNL